MRKILLGVLLFIAIIAVACFAVFENAARKTARHDLQEYYESHEELANLAYYTNWIHAANTYLGLSPERLSNSPLFWLRGKQEESYVALTRTEGDAGILIYADYLYYVKPCVNCTYSKGDVHLQKGLEIISDLTNYTGQNSLIARKGLEIAADTYEMVFQHNVRNVIITREEYYQMLAVLWRFGNSDLVTNTLEMPYLTRKKAFFFLKIFQRVSEQLNKQGVAKLGCAHPLTRTYIEMERKFDDIAQTAKDEIIRLSRGKTKINIESELRNPINADIRVTCP